MTIKLLGDDTVAVTFDLSSPSQSLFQKQFQRSGDDGDDKNPNFSKLLRNKINLEVGDSAKPTLGERVR